MSELEYYKKQLSNAFDTIEELEEKRIRYSRSAELNKKIGNWLYQLIKTYTNRFDYKEFLESLDISEEEYSEIKEIIESIFSCKL